MLANKQYKYNVSHDLFHLPLRSLIFHILLPDILCAIALLTIPKIKMSGMNGLTRVVHGKLLCHTISFIKEVFPKTARQFEHLSCDNT